MARFELTGPDGGKYELEAPDENAALAAFNQLHGGATSAPAAPVAKPPAFDPNDPRYAPHAQASAAALRGIPILGAGVEKAGAAISAAAQPLTGVGSDATSFADRYVKNLESEEAAKLDYETKHPIKSAVEGAVGGTLALGGFGGLVPAAGKALGMVGPLRQAATRAAVSGAGIGGADAALRGHDPVTGAEIGALTGAGGVVAGKAVGKVWDAARGAFRPAAPVPTRTMQVAGVDVPVPESVVTGNAAASELEQSAIHGGQGVRAQEVARGHRALTDEAMGRAHADFEASLDPTGTRPAASPMAAGEAIGTEVSAQEAARSAAEAARLRAVEGEGQALRGDLNTSPTPGVLADTPVSAAQGVRDALVGARDRLAGRRTAAYDELRATEGEFNPAVFNNTGARIRQDLNRGADPVRIDDVRTPQAAAALEDIELNVGQRRFENQVQTELQRGPDGRPMEPPITAETIDSARKRLISMQRTASRQARATGDDTDVRAMRRIVGAFDDHVARAAQTSGGFTGDPEQLLSRLTRARGLHAELKSTFGPRNPQDDVGKAIEKIVGKRDVAPAELETIAPLLFGNATEAGGQVQGRVAQRVIDIFGRDSPQVAQLKQGLISHILDTPAGMEPLSHAKAADKIHRFFSGTKGVGLAQMLFSPSERARFLAHANRMRSAHDPVPADQVEKTVAKWAGRDGGLKASPKQIVDDLMGSTGAKGTAPALVEHLQRRLSPDAISTLKQGVWSRITEGADGTIPWKDQKVGQRLMNFLNGDGKGLAQALYTPAELKAMREIGDAHIKLLPVEGTTNPSKSGHVIERAMKTMAHGLLPFLGFHAGGLPGAAAAFAAKGTVSRVVDRRAAGKAVERFYGPQPRRASAPSTLPQTFGALGGPVVNERRQSR